MKWFNGLPRLVQIILLLIPGVNWVVEIIVRVSAVIEKTNVGNILGLIFGIIDSITANRFFLWEDWIK